MNELTQVSIVIGLVGVIVYSLTYGFKRKELPNLGILFLLFVAGKPLEQSFKIGEIFKQSVFDGVVLNFGVLRDHQLVVAFGAIVLIWSVAYIYNKVFSSI